MDIENNNFYLALWDKFRLEGDQESLSVIYFDYYDLLFNYGLKHTKDRQIVEDSIQDLFSYLLKVRKTLGVVNNLPCYLLKSFRNQLTIDIKNNKKLILNEILQENCFDFFASPEQDLIAREQSDYINKVINRCIGNLTSKQREIIFLRFEYELPYEEIASVLGMTIESCHTTIYRTIKAIRTEAQKYLEPVKKISI